MRHLLRSSLYLITAVTLSMGISNCGSDSTTEPTPPADTTPPAVTRAAALDVNTVEIVFNELVDKASAEDAGNYSIVTGTPAPTSGLKSFRKPPTAAPGDPVAVSSAELQPDGATVHLTTDALELFTNHDIEVHGVADLHGNVLGSYANKIKDEIKSGRIYRFAGTGIPARGEEDVDPLMAELYWPQDLTFGPDGLCYIVDWNNHRIRVIEDGLIHTIIGTGLLGDAPDGPGLEIGLNHPTHVSFDPDGNLIMSAWHNSKVMRYDMATLQCEVVVAKDGQRAYGGDGGPAIDAIVNLPSSSQFDANGNLVISDQANYCIRMVDQQGIINTIVGIPTQPGFSGDEGPAVEAHLRNPFGQQAQPSGRIEYNADKTKLYIADTTNQRVRMVDAQGIIHTVAGVGTRGFSGDGGAAVDANLDAPSDVTVAKDGSFYIADTNNQCVRHVDNSGVITTVAGIGDVAGYEEDIDGMRATSVHLNGPWGVALDADGNLYIADTRNHRVVVVYK